MEHLTFDRFFSVATSPAASTGEGFALSIISVGSRAATATGGTKQSGFVPALIAALFW